MILHMVVIKFFLPDVPIGTCNSINKKYLVVFFLRENPLKGFYGGKAQCSNSWYVRYRSIEMLPQPGVPGTSNHALGDPEAYLIYKH